MSLWQFRAAIAGFAVFNGAEDDGLTREDEKRLAALLAKAKADAAAKAGK